MKQKRKKQGLRIQQVKKALQKRQKAQLGYETVTEPLRKQLDDVKQESASEIIALREEVATLKQKNRNETQGFAETLQQAVNQLRE